MKQWRELIADLQVTKTWHGGGATCLILDLHRPRSRDIAQVLVVSPGHDTSNRYPVIVMSHLPEAARRIAAIAADESEVISALREVLEAFDGVQIERVVHDVDTEFQQWIANVVMEYGLNGGTRGRA